MANSRGALIKWNGEIGPAAIIATLGSLSVLVALGIAWGSLKTDVQNSSQLAVTAKVESEKIVHEASKRDVRIAEQSERLGKIETSVGFIVPAIQRIEAKLDARK